MGVAHRIYAEALLEAAKDAKALDRVRDEFSAFVGAIEASASWPAPAQPADRAGAKRDALGDVLEGRERHVPQLRPLVAEKGRIGELEQIYAEWERLLAAEERIIELELTTAVELSDKEADGDREADRGRRPAARSRRRGSVDPDLIGGLVLQAGSLRLDGSVRGRLNSLREELLRRLPSSSRASGARRGSGSPPGR